MRPTLGIIVDHVMIFQLLGGNQRRRHGTLAATWKVMEVTLVNVAHQFDDTLNQISVVLQEFFSFLLFMQVSEWNWAWAKNSQEVVGKVCLMLSVTVTLIWECRWNEPWFLAQTWIAFWQLWWFGLYGYWWFRLINLMVVNGHNKFFVHSR